MVALPGTLGLDYLTGGHLMNWLGERSGGPTSNIPNADPNNFQLPGYNDRNTWANNEAANAHGMGRQAPTSFDSSFRGYQQNLANRLQDQMNGKDSLAQMQLRQQTDANIANQRALAAGAAPGNAAMAQRMAMQNIGRMNQGVNFAGQQLGIQERNAAANMLGQVAGQGRGQDLANSQFNANMELQNRGQNDQYALGMGQLGLANAGMQQRGGMGYEQNQTARRGQDLGIPQQPQNWERVVQGAAGLAPFFMAEGGVVTKPTDVLLGEAGPEAVLPLSTITGQQDDHSRRDQAIKGLQNSGDDMYRNLGNLAALMAAKRDKRAQMDQMMQEKSANERMQGSLLDVLHRGPRNGPSQGLPMSLNGPPQMLAEGGVVTKPTRAVVGESGPEVVVPLHKLPELITRLAQHALTPAPKPVQATGMTEQYGPPVPVEVAKHPEYSPKTQFQYQMYKAGMDARGHDPRWEPEYRLPPSMQAGTNQLSTGEWLAYLHGLGVK